MLFAIANRTTTTNPPNDDIGIIFAVIGAFILLYAVIWYFAIRVKYPFEIFYWGKTFTPKKARRIIGIHGEKVIDGQWTGWSQSLWKDNDSDDFFVLHLVEVEYPLLEPVKRNIAKNFIVLHSSPEHAKSLIKEWMNETYVP
jgi:hypothetical protein